MAVGPDEDRIRADAAAMAEVAAGSQRAFARVAEAETGRLLRLATSLTGSVAEAEEIVQEGLLRLWQAAPDWQPRAQIGTWLHRVVYRLCIDTIRRRRPSVDIAAIEEALPDGVTGPEALLMEDERERAIAAAMAMLPARQRAAILVAHGEGLSQAEAASALEVSEAAYESLLARGRRRLKELVSEALGEGPAEKDATDG